MLIGKRKRHKGVTESFSALTVRERAVKKGGGLNARPASAESVREFFIGKKDKRVWDRE